MIDKEYRTLAFVNSVKLLKQINDSNIENLEIFTLNFEVKYLSDELNIKCCYIDSIAPQILLEELNKTLADFLSSWFKDEKGNDLFNYKGINFGRAFLLKIWSEIVYQSRLLANISYLELSDNHRIIIDSNLKDVIEILNELNLSYRILEFERNPDEVQLFFDIRKYMNDSFKNTGIKKKFIQYSMLFIGALQKLSLFQRKSARAKTIYAQVYHPTIPIIRELRKDKSKHVVTNSVFGNARYRKYISVQNVFVKRGYTNKNLEIANQIIENFRLRKQIHIEKENLYKIRNESFLIEIILELIKTEVAIAVASVDSINKFCKMQDLSLYITIANLGTFETVLDEYCKVNGIPRYLVINGFLSNDHYIDSRDADFINCYSETIKLNFYKNSNFAFALGDPRMDKYALETNSKKIANDSETNQVVIGIGTAGYNNIDVLSYSAFEFEFIYGVLRTLKMVALKTSKQLKFKLKVRSNGVEAHYAYLLEKYFSDLEVEIADYLDFASFSKSIDVYISTYSQTLFEVASLGKPVIYFKKDTEVLGPPFNGNSELITAKNEAELLSHLDKIINGSDYSYATLERATIEKYFGYLDGKNLERNLNFINEILEYRGEPKSA